MYADVFLGGQNHAAPHCTIVRWRGRYRLGLLVTASPVGDGALEFRVAEDPAFRPMCDLRRVCKQAGTPVRTITGLRLNHSYRTV